VATLVARRERLRAGLLAQGWTVPDAQANFVWLPLGERTPEATDVFFDGDAAVRSFGHEGVRISVGEEESVDRVLDLAQAVRSTWF
jgi:histidinol-phosphate aminotransferase